MPLRQIRLGLSIVAVIALAASASAQPAAPTLQVQVSGQTVNASWNAVAGATSYRAEVGFAPNAMVGGYELGPLTTFSIDAPQGVYFLQVRARNAQGLGAPSNVVAVTVTSSQAPPAPPTNLSASVSGSTVTFTATPPSGATGLLLGAGVAPGQSLAVFPVSMSGQVAVPNVPAGTYYARMHAVNAGGTSGASNEVSVTVSAVCALPTAPNVSVQVVGSTVGVSWTAVGNAAAYRLEFAYSAGGPAAGAQVFPAGQTAASFPGVPSGTYYLRIIASNGCGEARSGDATVVVTPPSGGNRTPNPPAPTPPNYIPLPNRSAVVAEMARLYPGDLRNSCREAGGNNVWLFRLVQRLRQEDTRWGLNWKRARVGDMSQDIVTYNYGPETDEGTTFVHAVDVIGGHCGSSPSGTWNDVTVLWSTGAKWTLQPYLQAGYPLIP